MRKLNGILAKEVRASSEKELVGGRGYKEGSASGCIQPNLLKGMFSTLYELFGCHILKGKAAIPDWAPYNSSLHVAVHAKFRK